MEAAVSTARPVSPRLSVPRASATRTPTAMQLRAQVRDWMSSVVRPRVQGIPNRCLVALSGVMGVAIILVSLSLALSQAEQIEPTPFDMLHSSEGRAKAALRNGRTGKGTSDVAEYDGPTLSDALPPDTADPPVVNNAVPPLDIGAAVNEDSKRPGINDVEVFVKDTEVEYDDTAEDVGVRRHSGGGGVPAAPESPLEQAEPETENPSGEHEHAHSVDNEAEAAAFHGTEQKKGAASGAGPTTNAPKYDRDADDVITINEYFDRVFYVNVDTQTGRRDTMRAALKSVGILAERFPAIDAETPALQAQHEAYMQRPLGSYERRRKRGKLLASAGAFAYLKTCDTLVRMARQRGYKRILLLDDDVSFHSEFNREFDRKIRLIPDDWKVLYLGASQHVWLPTAITWMPGLKNEFYHPLVTDGSFAVALDASVFDLILFEMSKTAHNFDSGALRATLVPYHLQSYAFFPNLIVADVSQSLIRGPRNVTAMARALRWDMSLYASATQAEPLPTVCIVVAAHNAARTIEPSLESLLLQTHTAIEIIVVDDNSDDATRDIVSRVSQRSGGRVKLVRNINPRGPLASRAIGLVHCKGDIYMNHNPDDIASPDRVAVQISPIVDNRADITLAYGLRATFPGVDAIFHAAKANDSTDANYMFEQAMDVAFALVGAAHVSHANYVCCGTHVNADLATITVRRTVFQRAGMFDARALVGLGDEEFLERCMAIYMKQFISEGTFDMLTYLERQGSIPPLFEVVKRPVVVGPVHPGVAQRLKDTYKAAYRRRLIGGANPLSTDYNPF
eukprot:Opistho-2@33241